MRRGVLLEMAIITVYHYVVVYVDHQAGGRHAFCVVSTYVSIEGGSKSSHISRIRLHFSCHGKMTGITVISCGRHKPIQPPSNVIGLASEALACHFFICSGVCPCMHYFPWLARALFSSISQSEQTEQWLMCRPLTPEVHSSSLNGYIPLSH